MTLLALSDFRTMPRHLLNLTPLSAASRAHRHSLVSAAAITKYPQLSGGAANPTRADRIWNAGQALALSAVLLVLGARCALAEEKKADKAMEKVTYVDHVLPIFRAKCGSCHNANDKKGGLVLDNYSAMMLGGSSGTVIEAGDAGNSYLWSLITHTSEPSMPPNADKLPADQLAVIEKWINLGALENSGSKASIKKKPSLAKIEVSNSRPTEVAMPQTYYGDAIFTPAHVNSVTALAVSPWASLAAVSGFKQIGIYDTKSLDLLGVLPFPEGKAQIAKFSRNGSLLLIGGGRGGESGRVVVYDVRTGERKVEVGDEYDEVLGADISSDQTMIALGGPKKILRVYSVETGELLFENKKHTDWITAIEFSPDGVLLASGDRSNGLVVWESGSGQIFYELQGHKGAISDISWRPDSNVVASASEDGTIKLWEMQNGGLVKSWDAHGGGVTAMDYTREGDLVSTGRDRVTKSWKGDGAKIRDFPALADIAMEVAFDAETKRVLAGDWTGQVAVWNAEDGAPVGQFNTNPPTLKAQQAQLTARITELQTGLKAQQAALDGLQKGIAERAKKGEAAATAATQTAAAVKQATAQKQQAEEAVKGKQDALATAEKVQKEAQTAMAGMNGQLQQQTTILTGIQGGIAPLTAAIGEATKAQQAAAAVLADLTAKAAAAAQAAEPTAAEKPLLDSDEAVKKGVAERQAQAKAAQDAVKAATEQATAAQARLAAAQKKLNDAQAALAGTEKKVADLRQQATTLKTNEENATKGIEAARKAADEARAQLAAATQKEQVAMKAAADAGVAAQKGAEAAKPTADETKGIAAAQAAMTSLQGQIQATQAHLTRLQKAEAELGQTASAQ